MLFYSIYYENYQCVLYVYCSFLFSFCSRTRVFVHAFYIQPCARLYLSVFWWSVYLSYSLCTRTSSRHAYFLCTWMAISAALPITIIYIKFEINFTLFSLCNYVNSCCETKLHTWILMAVSFKSLWTLERKTQHYGNISVTSLQGFSVSEGKKKNLIIKYPLLLSRKTTRLSLDPSAHPSVCQTLNVETCLFRGLSWRATKFKVTTRTIFLFKSWYHVIEFTDSAVLFMLIKDYLFIIYDLYSEADWITHNTGRPVLHDAGAPFSDNGFILLSSLSPCHC